MKRSKIEALAQAQVDQTKRMSDGSMPQPADIIETLDEISSEEAAAKTTEMKAKTVSKLPIRTASITTIPKKATKEPVISLQVKRVKEKGETIS